MNNILFLGQKPIGEKCFQLLVDNQNENFSIRAVVSNKSCENVWWLTNYIYEYSISNNIAFVDNAEKNENKILEIITKLDINCIVCVGHGWILSDVILKAVSYNAVNLHLALLPQYKGNFTYSHAILNGEKQYGVTLHYMSEKVDEGDCIFKNIFPIEQDDTAYSLYKKSVNEGVSLFNRYLELMKNNKSIPRTPMEKGGMFYSRKSIDSLREIKGREEISRKYRAFYFPPFENAYFLIDNKKYYIFMDI